LRRGTNVIIVALCALATLPASAAATISGEITDPQGVRSAARQSPFGGAPILRGGRRKATIAGIIPSQPSKLANTA